MGPKTRKQTSSETVHIDRIVELKGSKLPSRGQVLGRLMQRIEELKETKREAARNVIQEVSPFWAKGGIPMREEQHCIVKLERLFDDFKNLKKSAYRSSQAQRRNQKEKEGLFLQSLNDLFYVAHADAMEIIAIPEDKKFLEMQRRSGRPGNFSGLDRKLAQKLQRSEQRQTKKESRRTKTQEEMEATARKVSTLDFSSGSESHSPSSEMHGATSKASTSSNTSLEPAQGPAEPRAQRETRAKNIMTPFLAASLDRTKISDRNAVFVISAVAKSLGHDLNTLAINRTSIRTARLRYREEIASKLRVDADAPGVFSVHWDGKLLSDLTGRDVVDRLPVLVSTYDDVSLLGVPKLASATGEAQATAIFDCLLENALDERVQIMGFDTTSSNTGVGKGACVMLEKLLERPLLWCACRHHVMELLLRAAWDTIFGASSAPVVPLFERFQGAWCGPESLQDIQYDASMIDMDLVTKVGDSNQKRITSFIENQISSVQPRDDYLELFELARITLGGKPTGPFRLPGAVSHARWMAKAIYALKIWLFRSHFRLSATERRRLPLFCEFVVSVYIEAWFQSSQPLSAPRLDLSLIKTLLSHSMTLPKKGNPYLAAATKLSSHLWYLSEEQVALALFDPVVSFDEKQKMAEAIRTRHGSSTRCTRLQVQDPHVLTESSLADFFNQNTELFFEITHIPTDFLLLHPKEWPLNESYMEACKLLGKVRVVNDVAERGVALIKSYNKLLTHDEEQLQYLLQVVTEHRKQFPDSKKGTILESMPL